jgi:pimeloyl-ACP methyl ester carboxylesterase
MSEAADGIEVDGVRLAVRARGEGPPVLLLHTGFVADGLLPLFRAPELDGWRLISYHRRGYGDSGGRGGGPVGMSRQAADVLALLDRLGVSRAHFVGHSLGADVAMQVAVTAPERVAGLVLMEPLLGFLLSPATADHVTATAAAAVPRFLAGDHAGALDEWLRGAFGTGYREVLDRALPGAWDQAVRDAPTAFGSEMPALQAWPFGTRDLAAITSPAFSVVSSATYWDGFRETHAALLAGMRDCEGAVVPVGSHLLQLADPWPVADAVAGFLRRYPVTA